MRDIVKRQIIRTVSLLLVLFLPTFFLVECSAAGESLIEFARVEGGVSLKGPGSGKYSPVSRGSSVNIGDTISTPSKSKAQLVFADGSFINIDEDSVVRVDNYIHEKGSLKRKTFLRIFKGSFRLVFRSMAGEGSLLYVETDDAMVTSRVADILISVVGGETLVLSIDGRANVKNRSSLVVGSVNINSNEQTIVRRGAKPSVKKIAVRSDVRRWLRKTDMLR